MHKPKPTVSLNKMSGIFENQSHEQTTFLILLGQNQDIALV